MVLGHLVDDALPSRLEVLDVVLVWLAQVAEILLGEGLMELLSLLNDALHVGFLG